MILLLLLLLSSECLVTAEEFTTTLGYRHIFVHCSLINNKIQIKATTICINVEYLALVAQLKSVHHNNCTEQSLYWESIVKKVKLRLNFFNS